MYISIHAAAFIWIFAIFGFAVFLWNILNTFFWLRQSRKGKYSIIISVKDQEETVEGIIRSLVLQSGLEGNEVPFLNVVVVDAGSTDETPKILEKLAREYTFVKVIHHRDLNESIKNVLS